MIAILSDVHGNLPALKSVLRRVEELRCSRIFFLGDVTGYCAEPGQCIDLLREWNAKFLLGNHDKYLIENTGCPRSATITSLMKYQRSAVTSEQIDFLTSLKPRYNEGQLTFVHGGWDDPQDQYLYTVSAADFPDGFSLCFGGHTHVQFLGKFGPKIYCNPGSVGQPRDGDCRAAFATMEGGVVHLHRVSYDIDAAALAMRRAGFTEDRLWKNLYLGAQIGGRVDRIDVLPSTR